MHDKNRRRTIAMALLAAALLAAGLGVAMVLPQPTARAGEQMTVQYELYELRGDDVGDRVAAARGQFVLASTEGLDQPFGAYVANAQAGTTVSTDLAGRHFAVNTATLAPVIGPFPVQGSALRAPLEEAVGRNLSIGDSFSIEGFTNATVVGQGGQRLHYTYDIATDVVHRLNRTSIPLRFDVDRDNGTFEAHVLLEPGDTFVIPWSCSYGILGLAAGTYEVTTVTDGVIELAYVDVVLSEARSIEAFRAGAYRLEMVLVAHQPAVAAGELVQHGSDALGTSPAPTNPAADTE